MGASLIALGYAVDTKIKIRKPIDSLSCHSLAPEALSQSSFALRLLINDLDVLTRVFFVISKRSKIDCIYSILSGTGHVYLEDNLFVFLNPILKCITQLED